MNNWSNRDRKLRRRRRVKVQDKMHKERGQGKDKQSKKRMAKLLKEQRRVQTWEYELDEL